MEYIPSEITEIISGLIFSFRIHSQRHWVITLGPPFFKTAADRFSLS